MSTERAPVLVTGGATRLGRAICERLTNAGYPVVVHYRHSADEARALAREIGAETVAGDLCDVEQTALIVETLSGRALSGIVNNASAFFTTPIGEVSIDDWNTLFGSNVRGPFFLVQGLLSQLVDGGVIVNVTDVHARRVLAGYSVYGMTKVALAQMTRVLAKELAPRIRVNAVAPGAILWPEPEPSAAVKRSIIDQIPLGRLGVPEDVARAVVFLFESPYMTGETITVDGGRSL